MWDLLDASGFRRIIAAAWKRSNHVAYVAQWPCRTLKNYEKLGWQAVDATSILVNTTACKRLFSLGCVPHTDGAASQLPVAAETRLAAPEEEGWVLEIVDLTEGQDLHVSKARYC